MERSIRRRRQITAAEDDSPDPLAYAESIRRCMQEAHQRRPTRVLSEGRIYKTGSWIELTEA